VNIFKDGILIDIDVGLSMTIKPELIKKFRSVEGKARRTIDSDSFLFPIGGSARFIPKNNLPIVIKKLETFKNKYCEIANKEINDELRSKFDISWNLYEINIPDPDLVPASEMDMALNIKKKIESFLETVVLQLRQEIKDSCERVIANVETGQIKGRTISSLKSMCKRLLNMNFLRDPIENEIIHFQKRYLDVYPTKRIREDIDIRSELIRRLSILKDLSENMAIVPDIIREYSK